jgi:hypothetical protein
MRKQAALSMLFMFSGCSTPYFVRNELPERRKINQNKNRFTYATNAEKPLVQ